MDSFEEFCVKICINSCPYEFMQICEYKRSRSFFDSYSEDLKHLLKTTGPVLTNFMQAIQGWGGTKFISNRPGRMINMAAMPIYGKKL